MVLKLATTHQGFSKDFDILNHTITKSPWLSRTVFCILYGFIVIVLAFCNDLGRDRYTDITSLKVAVEDLEVALNDVNLSFDWNKVISSPKLAWVPCIDGFECARLEVPMDYNDPEGEKVAIALSRVKAKVPPTSEEYRGPILFNPGGPGGSGVSFIFQLGKSFQTILGEEYDIVGFDPRSIGQTTPRFSLFNDPIERALWEHSVSLTVNASSPESLYAEYARSSIVGGLARTDKKLKQISEYSSTPLVARDMLTITRAHGYEKLQYWGFSYGTVLGATFAAMFPDNVGRLVMDGVVHLQQWFSAQWYNHLLDADKVLQYWYKACVEAGELCDLHANSTHEVERRVHTILESLISRPVAALNNSTYRVIDYGWVKSLLMLAVYRPFQAFPPLTSALASLENGDAKPLLSMAVQVLGMPTCESSTRPPPDALIQGWEEGFPAMCGERFGPSRDIENIRHELEYSTKRISILEDSWVTMLALPCTGWDIKQKYVYSGPFNATTSFPLLIIGNTADPVTPLLGARVAAEDFPNSRLMVIDTPGHSSLAAVSLESTRHIRNYFRKGILPPEGTVCPIEDAIFLPQKATSKMFLSGEDLQLVEAARRISQEANIRIGRYNFPVV